MQDVVRDLRVDAFGSVDDWEIYWWEGLAEHEFIRTFEENETSFKALGTVAKAASAMGA